MHIFIWAILILVTLNFLVLMFICPLFSPPPENRNRQDKKDEENDDDDGPRTTSRGW
jgi:uncharacterized protein YpmS